MEIQHLNNKVQVEQTESSPNKDDTNAINTSEIIQAPIDVPQTTANDEETKEPTELVPRTTD